jgi:hypothetical protein
MPQHLTSHGRVPLWRDLSHLSGCSHSARAVELTPVVGIVRRQEDTSRRVINQKQIAQ